MIETKKGGAIFLCCAVPDKAETYNTEVLSFLGSSALQFREDVICTHSKR